MIHAAKERLILLTVSTFSAIMSTKFIVEGIQNNIKERKEINRQFYELRQRSMVKETEAIIEKAPQPERTIARANMLQPKNANPDRLNADEWEVVNRDKVREGTHKTDGHVY